VIRESDVAAFVAFAVLMSPLPFLASVVAAIVVRRRRGTIGPLLGAVVAFTGGLPLGAMLLFATEPRTAIPILGFPLAILVGLWRIRRRAQAGWFGAGLALPWTLLWGFYTVVLVTGIDQFEPVATIGAFLLGAVPFALGLVIALRGDPHPPDPAIDAPPGEPGSRAFGSIAVALRRPTLIGPFGQPEIAMLVALVALWLVVPFLLPRSMPALMQLAFLSFVGAIVGTEVYVRSFPSRSRLALEAFSWLGEWELLRASAITGRSVPTSKAAAVRWLSDRSERIGEAPLRIEILLYTDRIDDARALLAQLPMATPWERFERAALEDLVQWQAGGDGDLPALEAAAEAILPPDGDERLRAEVMIAVHRVRRLVEQGVPATDAIQPFVDVRARLGRRADGQVGRAYRRRLVPVLLIGGLAFGVAGEVLGLVP
jgi:hypothetical protein